jgi:hypothetical protein
MTEDEVRALILTEAAKHEPKPWRSTGIGKWCKAKGINRAHVSEFMNGRRAPRLSILIALGLEWGIVPKATPTPSEKGEKLP